MFDLHERAAVGLDVYHGEATIIGEVEQQVIATDCELTSTKYGIPCELHEADLRVDD